MLQYIRPFRQQPFDFCSLQLSYDIRRKLVKVVLFPKMLFWNYLLAAFATGAVTLSSATEEKRDVIQDEGEVQVHQYVKREEFSTTIVDTTSPTDSATDIIQIEMASGGLEPNRAGVTTQRSKSNKKKSTTKKRKSTTKVKTTKKVTTKKRTTTKKSTTIKKLTATRNSTRTASTAKPTTTGHCYNTRFNPSNCGKCGHVVS
jgi:hypothetical protein